MRKLGIGAEAKAANALEAKVAAEAAAVAEKAAKAAPKADGPTLPVATKTAAAPLKKASGQ